MSQLHFLPPFLYFIHPDASPILSASSPPPSSYLCQYPLFSFQVQSLMFQSPFHFFSLNLFQHFTFCFASIHPSYCFPSHPFPSLYSSKSFYAFIYPFFPSLLNFIPPLRKHVTAETKKRKQVYAKSEKEHPINEFTREDQRYHRRRL